MAIAIFAKPLRLAGAGAGGPGLPPPGCQCASDPVCWPTSTPCHAIRSSAPLNRIVGNGAEWAPTAHGSPPRGRRQTDSESESAAGRCRPDLGGKRMCRWPAPGAGRHKSPPGPPPAASLSVSNPTARGPRCASDSTACLGGNQPAAEPLQAVIVGDSSSTKGHECNPLVQTTAKSRDQGRGRGS